MTKTTLLMTIMAIYLLAAYPHPAHACNVTDLFGWARLDVDCDEVQDFTEDADRNGDGRPDGDRVDNCLSAPNGNCEEQLSNCNVDWSQDSSGKHTVDKFEYRAGYQADWNHDGIGDACGDADRDGILDYLDNCKLTPNASQDPAACVDTDGDGFEDIIDNCPETYNTMQEDEDGDGLGDWCDNCRFTPNADQNPAACATKSEEPGLNITPPETPKNAVEDIERFRTRGTGGCGLTPYASQAPWGALIFLSALALAAIRRR